MKKISICTQLLFILLCACKKEYDYPPLKVAKDGSKISIEQLKSRLTMPVNHYRFNTGDTNLYCLVISDEQSGNFYREIFVRDEAGGSIQLKLRESGGLYTGDKIRINLNNTYLIIANSMIYLDSVDVAKNVVKLSSGNAVVPQPVTYDDMMLYSSMPTHANSLQSQLVELNGMEFKTNTLTPTFADAIGKTSVNQTITPCEPGKSLIIRTSGRCNFAGKLLPSGNGSIIGIVTQYNNTMQLTLRNYSDVNMNGSRCAAPTNTLAEGVFLVKDFNDQSINSGGWSSVSVKNNSVNWNIGTSSLTAHPYARISGYVGGSNTDSESWLISPKIDLSATQHPVLSFNSAAKFPGTVLEVLVCNDYQFGEPTSANWISLFPDYLLSPNTGNYLWTASGYISLALYKSPTTRIAFKYQSTVSGATSYYIDDIVIKEK